MVKRKMTGWLLMLTLLLTTILPHGAMAATGDLKSIAIDGEGTTLEMTVGGSKEIKVWGTFEGSTGTQDLTNTANWSSSDNSVVTVVKGTLTAIKVGTATIRADYNSATSSITVTIKESHKELKLEYSSEGKYSLDAEESDLAVKALVTSVVDGAGTSKDTDVTKDATWSSSNTSVLTVEKGQLTLVGEGTATVTAKYAGLTEIFKVTVILPYSKLELQYTPNGTTETAEDLELVVGDELQVNAQSTHTDDKDSKTDVTEKATWSTSDSSVVTVEKGKIKAVGLGKATVTATHLGVTAKTDVYVRTPYEVIIVNPSADQSMFIAEQIDAEARMRSGANRDDNVTSVAEWTSSNLLVATVSDGKIVARAAGSATIKVSHMGISKSIKVTVYPTVTALKAEKTKLELFKGDSSSLPKITATKLDEEELDVSDIVKWTSADESIAKIENGKVVAVAKGTVTLTAKLPSLAGTGLSVRDSEISVTLEVTEKVLTLLSDEEKLSVVIGEETKLPVITAVWEDGEEGDVSATVEWTLSGSNGVIKTSATGKTIKGLTKGSATLKGTFSNKTISIPVTIEQKITKVVVNPTSIELNLKKSKSIKVTGFYSNGKTVNLSSKMGWESSNPEVATISSTSVKAVALGTTTLTGSYQGHKISINVSVVAKLSKVTVDEKSLVLPPGSAKTVVLTAEYDTGSKATVTGSAVWTSSKPSVAKVTGGKIEAVAKGSATIKAVYGGKTVTIRVSVK